MAPQRMILLHRDAPPQPAFGQACNGCGLCCAAEPCPIGALASLRRRGRCRLLRWDADARRYLCGALPAGQGRLARLQRRLVARWIAAGIGCDSELRAA